MRTSRVAIESRCPKCGGSATGASDPMGDAMPAPDDLSVCAYCAAVLAFNHDMSVREATREDVGQLDLATAWKLVRYVGAVHLKLKAERDGSH